jgi:PKD repeat protein
MIEANAVGNQPPVADLEAHPASGDTPLPVALDASGSSDPDGSIVNYEWDFNGDGLYDAYGPLAIAGYTFTMPGSHDVWVRVTDDSGAQDTAQATVDVFDPGNAPPVASLTATPDGGAAPLAVALDASASSDPDGTIVKYEWDFDGDGLRRLRRPEQRQSYVRLARHLRRQGPRDRRRRQPGYRAGADYGHRASGRAGAHRFLYRHPGGRQHAAAGSGVRSGGEQRPRWHDRALRLGLRRNGVGTAIPSRQSPCGTPTQGDSYTPKLRVTDDDDLFDESTTTFSVSGPPNAVLEADETAGPSGTEINYDASNSSDPGGSIVLYEWDLDANGSSRPIRARRLRLRIPTIPRTTTTCSCASPTTTARRTPTRC